MSTDPHETRRAILIALDALKHGDRETARRMAQAVVAHSPGSEEAWLILAAVGTPTESVSNAQKALQINPKSQAARDAFAWALGRLRSQPTEPLPGAAQSQVSPQIQPEAGPSPEKPPPTLEREQAQGAATHAIAPKPEVSPGVVIHELKSDTRPSRKVAPLSREMGLGTPTGEVPQRDKTGHALGPLRSTNGRASQGNEGSKTGSAQTRISQYFLLGLAVLAVLTGLTFFRPQLSGLLAKRPTPVPTPPCVQPILKVGNARFPISSIARGADGSLRIPAQVDVAWWVEGTNVNYVFELNPSQASVVTLGNIVPGESINITWADCRTDEYVVSNTQTQTLIYTSLFDQSQAGVTIFIPTSSSVATLLIQGTVNR